MRALRLLAAAAAIAANTSSEISAESSTRVSTGRSTGVACGDDWLANAGRAVLLADALLACELPADEPPADPPPADAPSDDASAGMPLAAVTWTRPSASKRTRAESRAVSNVGATNTASGAVARSADSRIAGFAWEPAARVSSDCCDAPANRASQRSAHATWASAAGGEATAAASALVGAEEVSARAPKLEPDATCVIAIVGAVRRDCDRPDAAACACTVAARPSPMLMWRGPAPVSIAGRSATACARSTPATSPPSPAGIIRRGPRVASNRAPDEDARAMSSTVRSASPSSEKACIAPPGARLA